MTRRPSRTRAGLAAAVVVGGLLAVGPMAPARAADATGCEDIGPPGEISSSDERVPDVSASLPLTELDVPQAQTYLGPSSLGAGVTVAVIDSGVDPGTAPGGGPAIHVLPVPSSHVFTGSLTGPTYYHGTAVAGLIAGAARSPQDGGAVGIAPDASIVDLRVYEADPDATDGSSEPKVAPVKVLDAMLYLLKQHIHVDIVNVSLGLSMSHGAQMQQAIDQLWKRGTIVVAATGNRPTSQADFLGSEYGPSETASPFADAAGKVFPAGYDHVVGVNATADGTPSTDEASPSPVVPGASPSTVLGSDIPDATGSVLANSDTDVAAPTDGGVSYALDGRPCALTGVYTSWSTAEVSGVLALLRGDYPHATPAQLVARLTATASGDDQVRTPMVGAGLVQAYEALTLPLTISRSGRLPAPAAVAPTGRAPLPPRRPDLLRSTRHDAVWWGLLGGGGLALALLLRPVLSRRRTH